MGINLFPTYPAHWYVRSNTSTALLSGCLAVYWGVYEFVFSVGPNESGLNLILAILAGAHALYGLTLFFVLFSHHPKIAGFISFCLFFLVSAYTFWTSRDISSVYFAIMAITALVSGVYGWLVSVVANATILTLLIGASGGRIGDSDTIGALHIVLYAAISAMGLILWTSAGDASEQNHTTPKQKRPFFSRRSKSSSKKTDHSTLSTGILINSITDGVAIVSADGVIQDFNPSAQKITGWTSDETVGLHYKSVFVLSDLKDKTLDDQNNPISLCLTTGKAKPEHDLKLQTRSKKNIEVDVLASPIKSNEIVTAVIVIFRDVSKQRSEERQRAEFISTASHEMRTPVAAIEGYLALAMNDKVSKIDSTAKNYLDKAHASTQHLGKLFQDLLTAAKSEDGRLTNNPEPIEVGHLLDELIEGMRFTAEKKGLIMESAIGNIEQGEVRPVVFIHVDAERIREVITNLFDNAIKYTEDGKITIGMHADDKNVTISVTDTGAGIPKEDIPHLFQKFYRVDNSATRQVGGTGLGLFICRKIVELYNGRLWVDSELGEGSTFNITLPRISSQRAQELMNMANQRRNTTKPMPAAETPVAATPPATPAPQPAAKESQQGAEASVPAPVAAPKPDPISTPAPTPQPDESVESPSPQPGQT